MKRVTWYIIVSAITLAFLLLLWQFSFSIVLFGLSLAISAALKPFINQVAKISKSRRLALGLVYVVVIGSILATSMAIGQPLLQDVQKATDDFVVSYDRIKTNWPRKKSIFQQTLAEQLPSSDDLYQALTSEEGITTLAKDGGQGQKVFSVFGNIAIVLVLSMYWVADQFRFERITVSLFPSEYRRNALRIWRSIENGVGAYLQSEFIQSILAGLLLGAGYWMIGLRYPTLLAIWGATIRLIPWFGILFAVIPLLLLGEGSFAFSGALAIVYTVIVLLILKITIEPRFWERRRGHSLLIVLFIIVFAEAFGVIGVLLAPLLAVATQILFLELYSLFPKQYSQELQKAFELKKRLSKVRRSLKDPALSESTKFVKQLHQLVRQTITYMQKY